MDLLTVLVTLTLVGVIAWFASGVFFSPTYARRAGLALAGLSASTLVLAHRTDRAGLLVATVVVVGALTSVLSLLISLDTSDRPVRR